MYLSLVDRYQPTEEAMTGLINSSHKNNNTEIITQAASFQWLHKEYTSIFFNFFNFLILLDEGIVLHSKIWNYFHNFKWLLLFFIIWYHHPYYLISLSLWMVTGHKGKHNRRFLDFCQSVSKRILVRSLSYGN